MNGETKVYITPAYHLFSETHKSDILPNCANHVHSGHEMILYKVFNKPSIIDKESNVLRLLATSNSPHVALLKTTYVESWSLLTL